MHGVILSLTMVDFAIMLVTMAPIFSHHVDNVDSVQNDLSVTLTCENRLGCLPTKDQE